MFHPILVQLGPHMVSIISYYRNLLIVSQGSTQSYTGMAMSSSGQYQSACSSTHGVFASADYGLTWNNIIGTAFLQSISMSSSGQYQSVGTASTGFISVSIDYASTFSSTSSPSKVWIAISLCSNGQYQTAVSYGNGIYHSSDFGSTWTITLATFDWNCIGMSGSGSIQAAGISGGNIYISTNYGTTFAVSSSVSNLWYSIAVSNSGTYMVGVISGGYICKLSSFKIYLIFISLLSLNRCELEYWSKLDSNSIIFRLAKCCYLFRNN